MPVPASISELSQTPGSNYPTGAESPITADNYLREYSAYIAQLRDGKNFTDPVTLASATTTDIGAQNSLFVEVTGTTTITGFGTTYNGPRFLRFTGALILTHNATTLNLPGAANITTVAGDTCIAVPNSTPNGWNVVSYQRASGYASLGYNNFTGLQAEAEGAAVASAGTIDIWATDGNTRHITGSTGPITSMGTAPQAGAWMKLIFDGTPTLTQGANLNLNGNGSDIVIEAGDYAFVYADTTTQLDVIVFRKSGKAIVDGTVFASSAENAAGTIEDKAVDPLGIREAFNATGTAPVYACRAWANFNGTGTVAIRASGNVTSVTDNNTGDYTPNFTNSITDGNYVTVITHSNISGGSAGAVVSAASQTTSSVRIYTFNNVSNALTDAELVNVAIFR